MPEKPKDSGKWEKKTAEDRYKDKYRFNGERYSLRCVAHELGNDYIPQIGGLYPFPKGDVQDVN